MPKSKASGITPDEIVAALKRSSLSTVVVEGDDDIIVYRKLENELAKFDVDVIVAKGRNTLIEVFRRRAEINNGQKIAFIADRDQWVFAAVPEEFLYKELLFTDGYSIENDVYRDGKLHAYMDAAESTQFKNEIDKVIECYALAMSRMLKNQEGRVAVHPNMILDDAMQCAQLLQLEPGETYPTALRNQIAANYERLLRGKTLMGVLMRQLSRPGRPVRHHSKAMMDMVGHHRGPLLNSLFEQAKNIFT